MLALGIGALLAGTPLPGERDYSAYTFADFKAEFGKAYASADEAHRRETFERHRKFVVEHNADEGKTWHAAINEFADVPNAEFRASRTGLLADPAAAAAPVGSVRPAGPAPPSLDWREKGVVTAVHNQGSCGSCWAFSAVETLESRLALATNATPALELSTQQVVSCAPDPRHCGGTGGCRGGLQSVAYNYTSSSSGLSLASTYPYYSFPRTGKCDATKIKPVVTTKGFTQLPTNDYGALMGALGSGPVAISVAAGGLGWQFYGGGVYDGKTKSGGDDCGYAVDHGVQLVGYGNASQPSDAAGPAAEPRVAGVGGGYWWVRNSWGARWGEAGYMRVARYGEGNEPCGMDDKRTIICSGDSKAPVKYCGVCAIMSLSLVPTGVRKV